MFSWLKCNPMTVTLDPPPLPPNDPSYKKWKITEDGHGKFRVYKSVLNTDRHDTKGRWQWQIVYTYHDGERAIQYGTETFQTFEAAQKHINNVEEAIEKAKEKVVLYVNKGTGVAHPACCSCRCKGS